MNREHENTYFDYNASSPFATSVLRWLSKGDLPFANPSSIHASGRYSRKLIHQVESYFLELFGLQGSHDIIFHSGATEGINMVLQGFANFSTQKSQTPVHFFYSPTDHSAVTEVAGLLKNQGHQVHSLKVNGYGQFELENAVTAMAMAGRHPLLLNYTYVNNETGVVWPLDGALEIKRRTGALIHVDAVQAPGRIENFQKLSPLLDAYTFSGHKFGSLKGVGLTLVKKDFPFLPLLRGGGQQGGKRSGTENAMGVFSMKLAMEELLSRFQFSQLNKAKMWLEDSLADLMGQSGFIVARGCPHRNGNTITLVLKNARSDLVTAAMDLHQIEVSSGSACSSGSLSPNRVLMSMGIPEDLSRCIIRLSFSPYLNMEEAEEYFQCLKKVLVQFL